MQSWVKLKLKQNLKNVLQKKIESFNAEKGYNSSQQSSFP